MSWEYAEKLETQLRAEVQELMRMADEADQTPTPEDMDVPEELARREQRLEVIARAKKEIEARARERYERERAEYEAKMAKRDAYEDETGKKARGRTPSAPSVQPNAKDQVSLTDKDLASCPPPVALSRRTTRKLGWISRVT